MADPENLRKKRSSTAPVRSTALRAAEVRSQDPSAADQVLNLQKEAGNTAVSKDLLSRSRPSGFTKEDIQESITADTSSESSQQASSLVREGQLGTRRSPGGKSQPVPLEGGNFTHKYAEPLRQVLPPPEIPERFAPDVEAGNIIPLVELPDGLLAEQAIGSLFRADRVTVVDAENGIIYEIKPDTVTSIRNGQNQVLESVELANQSARDGRRDWRGIVVVYNRKAARWFVAPPSGPTPKPPGSPPGGGAPPEPAAKAPVSSSARVPAEQAAASEQATASKVPAEPAPTPKIYRQEQQTGGTPTATPPKGRTIFVDNNVFLEVARGNEQMAAVLRARAKDPQVELHTGRGIYTELTRDSPSADANEIAARKAMLQKLGIKVVDAGLAKRAKTYERYSEGEGPLAQHGHPSLSDRPGAKQERAMLKDLPHIAEAEVLGAELWTADKGLKKNARALGVSVAPESDLEIPNAVRQTSAQNILRLIPEVTVQDVVKYGGTLGRPPSGSGGPGGEGGEGGPPPPARPVPPATAPKAEAEPETAAPSGPGRTSAPLAAPEAPSASEESPSHAPTGLRPSPTLGEMTGSVVQEAIVGMIVELINAKIKEALDRKAFEEHMRALQPQIEREKKQKLQAFLSATPASQVLFYNVRIRVRSLTVIAVAGRGTRAFATPPAPELEVVTVSRSNANVVGDVVDKVLPVEGGHAVYRIEHSQVLTYSESVQL